MTTTTRPVAPLTEVYERTESLGYQRSRDRIVSDESRGLHQNGVLDEWTLRSTERGRSSVVSLLAELADLGFAWRDIARMVGVSVPAVQKWRRGDAASGENRARLARLVAACDLVTEHAAVADVASWFEMPLSPDAPVTPMDLWSDARHDLVFECALDRQAPSALLDQWDPDWRERFHSDYEVAVADDGRRYLRPAVG
jgi:transcriptional regulator with XRE-family HTH domain